MILDEVIKSAWRQYVRSEADYLKIENDYIDYGFVNFLLTKNAHHNQGDVFLKKMLEILDLKFDIENTNTQRIIHNCKTLIEISDGKNTVFIGDYKNIDLQNYRYVTIDEFVKWLHESIYLILGTNSLKFVLLQYISYLSKKKNFVYNKLTLEEFSNYFYEK